MKYSFWISTAAIVLTICCIATTGSALTLSVSEIDVQPGDTVTITVTLNDAADVAAAGFKLSFDPGVLVPKSTAATSSGGTYLVEATANPVSVAISLARGDVDSDPSGERVLLQFSVPESAEIGHATTLTFSNATAYGISGDSLTVSDGAGTVTVTDGTSDPGDDGGSGGSGGGDDGGGGGCFIHTVLR